VVPATTRAVNRGLIIGGCVVYFLAVGMFERFTARPVITDLLTLGWTVLAGLWAVAGVWAARTVLPPASSAPDGDEAGGRTARAVTHAALAGLLAGAVPALFLLLADAINLRPMLINAGATMVNALAVDDSAVAGALRLVLAALVIATVAGIVASAPAQVRRVAGWALGMVVLLALVEPLLRVIIASLGLRTSWLYQRGGLGVSGAVIALVLGVAVGVLRRRDTPTTARDDGDDGPRARLARGGRIAGLVAGAVLLLVLPRLVGPFLSEVVGTIGLFAIMGIGLNIVVGSAGLLHLGYVAFFAIGAYVTALLTSPAAALGTELSFWAALPIVVLVTAIAGLFVGAPVLRLRGDYLAIVTLAFGEIARILALSDWLRPALGGAQGILAVPAPTIGAMRFRDPQMLYYVIIVACAITAFIAWRLEDSRVGRAWTAMREDEQVAQIMGISISRYKLLAFALGAGIASVSGALFAVKIGSVFPHSFDILVSITALSVVILGGIGSLRGVFLGALVLVGLPDLLREFGEYRMLLYGGLLVAIMILRPQGLLPNVRRMAELGEEERLQDQWLKRAGDAGDPEPAIATTKTDGAS